MSSVANWSSICEKERCLYPASQFSQYRYFKICKVVSSEKQNDVVQSACSVKCVMTDEWKQLLLREDKMCTDFLSFAPDITKPPPRMLGTPPVTRRLQNGCSQKKSA